MKEGNAAKVRFRRKSPGSVSLDVGSAPRVASRPLRAEPERGAGDRPEPDRHPRLSMDPFDPAGPAARTTEPPVERRIETARGPGQRRREGARNLKRSPDYGKMWARHCMLLPILLITLGLSSYQTARVYRHFMKLDVSTLTLTPAMLLAMILASLAVLWGVSGRRYESVALAIIAMGGIFAFLGLICKVVMILHGRA